MTTQELINKLQKLSPDTEIKLRYYIGNLSVDYVFCNTDGIDVKPELDGTVTITVGPKDWI